MYQKTQDRRDYLDRVASHATKGSGRGTVWWNVPRQPRAVISFKDKQIIDRLKEERRADGGSGKRRRKKARFALAKIYKNIYRNIGEIDSGT